MKNLILASALALSSVMAPAAAHAGGPNEFGGARFQRGHAVVVQRGYAPSYAQPTYAPPAYVPPVYVQPPAYAPSYGQQYAHRDDRGERGDWRDRGFDARRDDGRFDRRQHRDADGWQFSRAHEGWRR